MASVLARTLNGPTFLRADIRGLQRKLLRRRRLRSKALAESAMASSLTKPFSTTFELLVGLVVLGLSTGSAAVRAEDAAEGPFDQGLGVASLSGDGALLQPSGYRRKLMPGGGLSLQVIGRQRTWPVMIGVGGGVLHFLPNGQAGPRLTLDGMRSVDTRVSRGLDMRHVELIVRVERFWGAVRPFAEGSVGVAVLWSTARLLGAHDAELGSGDKQRNITALFGLSLGVDFRLWSSGKGRHGTWDLVMTTGIRRWWTSGFVLPSYHTNEAGRLQIDQSRRGLGLWMPFVALSFAIDSRREACVAQSLGRH